MGERRTVVALGLVVGLVLADSSVVILALPDILDHFDVSIDHVAWVRLAAAYDLELLTAARHALGLVADD